MAAVMDSPSPPPSTVPLTAVAPTIPLFAPLSSTLSAAMMSDDDDMFASGAVAMETEGPAHYRGLMQAEKARLTATCDEWEAYVSSHAVSDVIAGDVSSAVGKARLICNSRFKQVCMYVCLDGDDR